MELDTTKLRQAGFRKTVTHDNCIVLDISTGSFPRRIEVRPPGDDGSRMTAIWNGSLDLAVNDKVKCIEYSGNPIWSIESKGGNDAGTDSHRVSKLWESDFGAVAFEADAAGNLTLNGTRTLTLPTDIIHAGDADTKISFTDDDIEFTAGALSMLKLTETTQDLITLGPGSGDVDIDFNGDMFLQGSDGFIGIGTTSPDFSLDVSGDIRIEGSNKLHFRGTGAADNTIGIFGNQSAGGTFDQIRIQSNVTNNSSVLQVIPNGTGAGGIPTALEFFGTDAVADGTNFERLNIRSGSTYFIFTEGNGTGIIRPLSIYTEGNTNQLYLATDGNIGIGRVTSPSAALHIDQRSTTAAEPVLFLDQGDISEQCITFSSDGVDRDIIIYDINMTGTPTMLWDESADGLNWSKAFLIQGLFSTSAGQIKNTTRVTSSPYTVLATDNIIIVDTDGGAITVNLPAGIDGTHYRITNVGTAVNDVTVDPNGTEQLFGGGAGVSFALIDGETINIYFETTENWW